MTGEQLRDVLIAAGVPADLIEVCPDGHPGDDEARVVILFDEDEGAFLVKVRTTEWTGLDTVDWTSYAADMKIIQEESGWAYPVQAGVNVVAMLTADRLTRTG